VFRGEINSRGHREQKPLKRRESARAESARTWKSWEIQAPETENAEGNKTSREAHKTLKSKNVRGELQKEAQQIRSLKESETTKGVKPQGTPEMRAE
jgi:hypothetical protein